MEDNTLELDQISNLFVALIDLEALIYDPQDLTTREEPSRLVTLFGLHIVELLSKWATVWW